MALQRVVVLDRARVVAGTGKMPKSFFATAELKQTKVILPLLKSPLSKPIALNHPVSTSSYIYYCSL